MSDAYEKEVVSGDLTTVAHFWGEAFGQIVTVIATDGASTDIDAEEEITSASIISKGAGEASPYSNLEDSASVGPGKISHQHKKVKYYKRIEIEMEELLNLTYQFKNLSNQVRVKKALHHLRMSGK